MINDLSTMLESTARLAAPLAFVALGELISEKAGACNISAEGMMLGGAFGAAWGSYATGSPVLGLMIGMLSGAFVGFLQGRLSHWLSLNQFVVGLTLNIFVLGLTTYLFQNYRFGAEGFARTEIPVLSSIPIIGEALFGQPWPFYLLYAAVPGAWWALYRTRWGLNVRSVGEAARESTVTGIDVNRIRRQAVIVGAAIAGFGGAYLALGVVGNFGENMTAGRGYVAMAAVIFGAWSIKGTLAGCLVFGAADALRLALPAMGYELNPQLLIAAPYVLALITMAVFASRNRSPQELGIGFDRHALR